MNVVSFLLYNEAMSHLVKTWSVGSSHLMDILKLRLQGTGLEVHKCAQTTEYANIKLYIISVQTKSVEEQNKNLRLV